ncbi:hypothetical protein A4X03_0g6413 [Tilletia caries]|uniref:Thioredoxin domain-containing protein n=1 Tax=Tilletia caries TaxID=13290 RepID=A0A177U2L6_9BASI|nr:hypothetical protein A4X03_0g6413 [Tilletia caries]
MSSARSSSASASAPAHSSSLPVRRPNSTPPTINANGGNSAVSALTSISDDHVPPSAAKYFTPTDSRPTTASSAKFEIPGAASQDASVFTSLQPPPRSRRRRPGSVSLNAEGEAILTRAAIEAATAPVDHSSAAALRPSFDSSIPNRSSEQSGLAEDPDQSTNAVPSSVAKTGVQNSRQLTSSNPTPPGGPHNMSATLPMDSPIRAIARSASEDALKQNAELHFKQAEPGPISVTLPRLSYQPPNSAPLPFDRDSQKNGYISTLPRPHSRGDPGMAAVDLSVEAQTEDGQYRDAKSSGFTLLAKRRGSKSAGGDTADSGVDPSMDRNRSNKASGFSVLVKSLSRPGSSSAPNESSRSSGSTGSRKIVISGPVAGTFQSSSPMNTMDLPITAAGLSTPASTSLQGESGGGSNEPNSPIPGQTPAFRKGSAASFMTASSSIQGAFLSDPFDAETTDGVMTVEGEDFIMPTRKPSQPTMSMVSPDAPMDDWSVKDPLSDVRPAASAPAHASTPPSAPGRRESAGTAESSSSSSHHRSPNSGGPVLGRGTFSKLSTPPVSSSGVFAANLRERASLSNMSTMTADSGRRGSASGSGRSHAGTRSTEDLRDARRASESNNTSNSLNAEQVMSNGRQRGHHTQQRSTDTTAGISVATSMSHMHNGGMVGSSSSNGTSTTTFPASLSQPLGGSDDAATFITASDMDASSDLTDPRQPPPGAYAIHLPTMLQLFEASQSIIYDEDGKQVRFGDLFKRRRTLVCFLRHWWCGFCQEFALSLQEIDPEPLRKAELDLVVIGQGDWHVTKAYKSVMQVPFPMYADPNRHLYKALGMTVRTNDAGPACAKPDYAKSGMTKAIVVAIKKGLFDMPLRAPGDMKLLGGEFILGPGLQCSFVHRMVTTRGHLDVPRVLAQAGIETSVIKTKLPPIPPIPKEADDASSTKALPERPHSVNSLPRSKRLARGARKLLKKTSKSSNLSATDDKGNLREPWASGPPQIYDRPRVGYQLPPLSPSMSYLSPEESRAQSMGLRNHSSATLDADVPRTWGRSVGSPRLPVEDRFNTSKSLGSPTVGAAVENGAEGGRVTPTQESVLKTWGPVEEARPVPHPARAKVANMQTPRPVSKDGPGQNGRNGNPPVAKISSFDKRDIMTAALQPMARGPLPGGVQSSENELTILAHGNTGHSRLVPAADGVPRIRQVSVSTTTDESDAEEFTPSMSPHPSSSLRASPVSTARSGTFGGTAMSSSVSLGRHPGNGLGIVPVGALPDPPQMLGSSLSRASVLQMQLSPAGTGSGTGYDSQASLSSGLKGKADSSRVVVPSSGTFDTMDFHRVLDRSRPSVDENMDDSVDSAGTVDGDQRRLTVSTAALSLGGGGSFLDDLNEIDGLVLRTPSPEHGQRDSEYRRSPGYSIREEDEDEEDKLEMDDIEEEEEHEAEEYRRQMQYSERPPSRSMLRDSSQQEDDDDGTASDDSDVLGSRSSSRATRASPEQVMHAPLPHSPMPAGSDRRGSSSSSIVSIGAGWTPRRPSITDPIEEEEEEYEEAGQEDGHGGFSRNVLATAGLPRNAGVSHSRGSSYEAGGYGSPARARTASLGSDSSAGTAERARRKAGSGPGVGSVYLNAQRALHEGSTSLFEDDELSASSHLESGGETETEGEAETEDDDDGRSMGRSTAASASSTSNSPSPNGSLGRNSSASSSPQQQRSRDGLPPQPPQPQQPLPRFHRLGPLAAAGPRARLSVFDEEEEESGEDYDEDEDEDDDDEEYHRRQGASRFSRGNGVFSATSEMTEEDDEEDDEETDEDDATEMEHGQPHRRGSQPQDEDDDDDDEAGQASAPWS